MKKLIKMAIAYDFDGTLAPGNMQEHSFIPDVATTTKKFWKEVKKFSKVHEMDEVSAYMHLMIEKANRANKSITRKSFKERGKTIKLFVGVDTWFKRINEYAKTKGVTIEHFIISSGLKEMIEGTKIGKKFKHIFASNFMYLSEAPKWPAISVNYTTKTQYLFRINKGIFNCYDNEKINKFTPDEDRYIPFLNMIYIGDGETDIPCMKIVKQQGGHSIAVYNPDKRNQKTNNAKLIKDNRADWLVSANYSERSDMDELVKDIICKIAIENKLRCKRAEIIKMVNKKRDVSKKGNKNHKTIITQSENQAEIKQ